MRETREHVLRGHGFLAHARCRGLHSYDHATMVVDQIVVVVPQPGRRAALGGVGGIGIGGRYLVLLVFLFSSRRRHTRCGRDWSSDVSLPICFVEANAAKESRIPREQLAE